MTGRTPSAAVGQPTVYPTPRARVKCAVPVTHANAVSSFKTVAANKRCSADKGGGANRAAPKSVASYAPLCVKYVKTQSHFVCVYLFCVKFRVSLQSRC